jgi:hypothetical protein
MEQHVKEKSLLEGSNISTKYDYQMALKDRSASKIELEQSTLRLRMYQEESIQLKKHVEEQTVSQSYHKDIIQLYHTHLIIIISKKSWA